VIQDVAIVGGGPAGLALAIDAASMGLDVVVLEKRTFPCEKACGEGLLPAALVALERLGVRAHLPSTDSAPLRAVRWISPSGLSAVGRLPGAGGLGVRRLALSSALAGRAVEQGATLRERVTARGLERTPRGVQVLTEGEPVQARVVVAADGLGSALRREERLDGAVGRDRRFGVRRHFHLAPWSDEVELHFGEDAEAYVTPAGTERVGVAILWRPRRQGTSTSFATLLTRFPALERRLRGAPFDSSARGAGPLDRRARSVVGDRFALLGDAAGYVDAITGEGLSVAFESAHVLAQHLPDIVAGHAAREGLAAYARAHARIFRRYEWVTRGVLSLSAQPTLRDLTLAALSRMPTAFDRLIAWAVEGPGSQRPTFEPSIAP